jgi:hypothetical protein
MNNTSLKKRNIFILLLVACALFQVACKKENSTGSPSITGIRAITPDSSITSALPGQIVVIQGANLASAMAISFNGFPATFNSALFSNNNLVVRIPAIGWDSIPSGKLNTLEVQTAGGAVTYKFTITPPAPNVTSVSDENALAGQTLTINGTDFYGVAKVTFPGGKEGTNLVSTGTTQMTVTVPDGITSADSLRLTGTYGTGASKFVFDNYLSPGTGFLANFEDGDAHFGWQWWGGIKEKNPSAYPNSTGNYIRIHPSGAISGGDGSWYADNRAVMVAGGAWVSSANLSDPIGSYALKFEIYVKTPWTNGSLMIAPAGNFNYLARYAPWEKTGTGSFVTSGWQTVTIPLTSFLSGSGSYNASGKPAPNIAALTGGTNSASLQIMLYNDSATPLAAFDAAVDNVRIVKVQ